MLHQTCNTDCVWMRIAWTGSDSTRTAEESTPCPCNRKTKVNIKIVGCGTDDVIVLKEGEEGDRHEDNFHRGNESENRWLIVDDFCEQVAQKLKRVRTDTLHKIAKH